jgi:hypothetical protein
MLMSEAYTWDLFDIFCYQTLENDLTRLWNKRNWYNIAERHNGDGICCACKTFCVILKNYDKLMIKLDVNLFFALIQLTVDKLYYV